MVTYNWLVDETSLFHNFVVRWSSFLDSALSSIYSVDLLIGVDFSISSTLGTSTSHNAAQSEGAIGKENESNEQAPSETIVPVVWVVIPTDCVLSKIE